MDEVAVVFIAFLLLITALYSGLTAAVLAAVVAAAMYMLPPEMDHYRVPLFAVFLGIIGFALLPRLVGFTVDSVTETAVYLLDAVAGAIVDHGAVGAVAVVLAVFVLTATLWHVATDRHVQRSGAKYFRKYWERAKAHVRGFRR